MFFPANVVFSDVDVLGQDNFSKGFYRSFLRVLFVRFVVGSAPVEASYVKGQATQVRAIYYFYGANDGYMAVIRATTF